MCIGQLSTYTFAFQSSIMISQIRAGSNLKNKKERTYYDQNDDVARRHWPNSWNDRFVRRGDSQNTDEPSRFLRIFLFDYFSDGINWRNRSRLLLASLLKQGGARTSPALYKLISKLYNNVTGPPRNCDASKFKKQIIQMKERNLSS